MAKRASRQRPVALKWNRHSYWFVASTTFLHEGPTELDPNDTECRMFSGDGAMTIHNVSCQITHKTTLMSSRCVQPLAFVLHQSPGPSRYYETMYALFPDENDQSCNIVKKSNEKKLTPPAQDVPPIPAVYQLSRNLIAHPSIVRQTSRR